MERIALRVTARAAIGAHVAAAALLAMLMPAPAIADRGGSAFTDGRLWRIARPGVGDSYVFGTIHVVDARVSAIPGPVDAAMARTRTLAMEMPPVEVVEARAFEQEQQDNGGRLEPLIGPEAFDQVRRDLSMNGTPQGVIERLKPWAAMMKLTWGRPRGETRSLDENLLVAARERRMKLNSLESIDEQIAAFDAIPLDTQVALLKNALAHRDALEAATEPAIAAWQRGDLAALARMPERIGRQFPGMAPHYAQLTQHIVEDRTILMHHRLALPLRSGGVFVAVGALHLYGDRGLLAMLKRDGYRVTRVWN